MSTRRRKSGDRRAAVAKKEDYEDEIERFHRERIAQDDTSSNSEEESSESDEEEVLGIGSEKESDESGDSDLDSEEEIEKGTRYGQLLKQAKAIKAKLDIARGEDDDEDASSSSSEEESDKEDEARWGSRKSAYYDADIVDMEGSDEDEDLEAEEKEATRLQKEAADRIEADDYGSLSEDDLNDTNLEKIMQLDELDDDEKELRASAVRQDALELKALLQELRASLSEIRARLGPLLQEVKSGDIATAEGVSYLEAKHLLLLHYVACLVFYLLLKSEGRSVKDHPVISKLIEIRSYLEKTRPIDRKLKYQIGKLLAAAEMERDTTEGPREAEAPLSHKPRPGALVIDDGEEKDREGIKGEAYRPPKLNPVSMELDETDDIGTGRLSAKERRKQINASRKAARSSFVQEFAAELSGAPEEKKMGVPVGMDTAEALRHRQKLAARENVEEELMIRVPLSKDERKRLKAQRRAGLSGKALLDDFQDDIADLVNGNNDIGIGSQFSRHKKSQLYGVDDSNQKKTNASGDADVPERISLASRRAAMDSVRAKRAISYEVDEEPGQRVETDFYKASKMHLERQKKQKKESRAPDQLLPPLAEPVASGARKIDSSIEKNRGLTPHRRKDLKNPRKKHRIKYAEANVRRRGQVQAVKSGAAGGYGGESTGIKSKVSKSVKF